MDDLLAKKIERFQALKERMPASELPRWTLAQCLEEARRFEDARAEYEALVALKPDYCLAWLRLGALLLGPLAEPDLAKSALTEARRLALEQGHNAPRLESEALLRELSGEAGDPRATSPDDDDEDWPS